MFVIVTYDVNQKRDAKIIKICRKYLTHVQKSVFEGDISEKQIVKLQKELKVQIKPKEDQIAIYKVKRVTEVTKEQIGYIFCEDNII